MSHVNRFDMVCNRYLQALCTNILSETSEFLPHWRALLTVVDIKYPEDLKPTVGYCSARNVTSVHLSLQSATILQNRQVICC